MAKPSRPEATPIVSLPQTNLYLNKERSNLFMREIGDSFYMIVFRVPGGWLCADNPGNGEVFGEMAQ
jgi:hypothetical protein